MHLNCSTEFEGSTKKLKRNKRNEEKGNAKICWKNCNKEISSKQLVTVLWSDKQWRKKRVKLVSRVRQEREREREKCIRRTKKKIIKTTTKMNTASRNANKKELQKLTCNYH